MENQPPKKKGKGWFWLFLLLLAGGAGAFWFSPFNPLAPGVGEEITDPEYLKLSAILDKYKESSSLKVIFNNVEHPPAHFVAQARWYLKRTYKMGDKAADWIDKNCYRTFKGNIVYFKYSNGETRPVRDVFLEELEKLN